MWEEVEDILAQNASLDGVPSAREDSTLMASLFGRNICGTGGGIGGFE